MKIEDPESIYDNSYGIHVIFNKFPIAKSNSRAREKSSIKVSSSQANVISIFINQIDYSIIVLKKHGLVAFNVNIDDLFALNEQRERLVGAYKITIVISAELF